MIVHSGVISKSMDDYLNYSYSYDVSQTVPSLYSNVDMHICIYAHIFIKHYCNNILLQCFKIYIHILHPPPLRGGCSSLEA